MKRRILVLLTALIMALTLSAAPVLAAGGNHYGKGKEKVCVKHYTGSKKNTYNYISIPKKAFYKGHMKHGDQIVADTFCEK